MIRILIIILIIIVIIITIIIIIMVIGYTKCTSSQSSKVHQGFIIHI